MRLLVLDGFITQSMHCEERKRCVVPALECLPVPGAESAEGVIVGCGEEQNDEECADEAGIVGEPKQVMPEREQVTRPMLIDVIEPRAATEMHILAYCRMQDSENPSPYADVPSDIAGDWITA